MQGLWWRVSSGPLWKGWMRVRVRGCEMRIICIMRESARMVIHLVVLKNMFIPCVHSFVLVFSSADLRY
jgi:hypothetical protein